MLTDDLITRRLGALAHPVRLGIVRMLAQAGPRGLPAGKLGASLSIAPNALTFHLQKLAHVSLVSARREGQFNIYNVAFDNLLELTDYLVGACCADASEKCGPRCPPSRVSPAQSILHPLSKKGEHNE